MFLLISLNEKNTAGSEVLRQAASDVSPGRGGGGGGVRHSLAQQIIRERQNGKK